MSFSNKEKTRISSKYGPWALITGASSGIGKELAIRLAEAGMHLVIIARNKDRLIQLSDELSEQFGVEVISITADLANEREVQQVIQRTQFVLEVRLVGHTVRVAEIDIYAAGSGAVLGRVRCSDDEVGIIVTVHVV